MADSSKPIVIAIPSQGFDPSEAAVTWQVLKLAKQQVLFATPDGNPAAADPLMVTGVGLDWWGWIPGIKHLKAVGLLLRANAAARGAYAAMLADEHYQSPMCYADIHPEEIDGLVLPGGHAKSMRPFLEDKILQDKVRACMTPAVAGSPGAHLPVAAICHGVLVLARTQGENGKSVIFGRKLTALPWDFERKAWVTGRIFRFWDPHYYRTYLEQAGDAVGYWSVEAEIIRSLESPEDFRLPLKGTQDFALKTSGLHRDTVDNSRPSWVVEDGNLVTARWPGDVHTFAKTFLHVLQNYRQR